MQMLHAEENGRAQMPIADENGRAQTHVADENGRADGRLVLLILILAILVLPVLELVQICVLPGKRKERESGGGNYCQG
jgi:hypothetical protein